MIKITEEEIKRDTFQQFDGPVHLRMTLVRLDTNEPVRVETGDVLIAGIGNSKTKEVEMIFSGHPLHLMGMMEMLIAGAARSIKKMALSGMDKSEEENTIKIEERV